MAERTRGSRRYTKNRAPPAPRIVIGSADKMVSTADEAIGLASSITLVVFCATSETVCSTKKVIHFSESML